MRRICCSRAVGVAVLVLIYAQSMWAQMPSYDNLYDPLKVLNLNVQMDPSDWAAIRNDSSYTLVKPGYLWADTESKILVSVRRKPNQADGDKVALKIDVNESFDNLRWHGVKKLSLENGFDKDVVSEGFTWYLHRQAAAADERQFGYSPSLASWVNVQVNGQRLGVYVNVEQPDLTFLRNRDMWSSGRSWLYKQGDLGPAELREGPLPGSPQFQALDYLPFDPNPNRPTPPAGQLTTELPQHIDMRSMLLMGAVEQFSVNPDAVFSKGKNMFFADFEGASGARRQYMPWDQDAVLRNTNASIYGQGPYADTILNHPVFREQYRQIMQELLVGPLSVATLHGFLNELEAVLTPSLIADPFSNIGDSAGDVEDHFDKLRLWVTQRHANVLNQLSASSSPETSVPEPGTLAYLSGVAVVMLLRPGRRKGRKR